ncbi:MAG: hypothetical protein HY347_03030 [candidate division NC10 bacterium]|nr:hypothetical protein [candidate division NC10 bacterium]
MKLCHIRVVLVLLIVGTVLGLLALERAGANSVVCGGIPERGVCVTEVGVDPPNPTPEDSIEVIVSGTFSDSCPEVLGSSHTLAGNVIFISILIELHPEAEACAAVIKPWSITEPIGQLPAGDYTVEVITHLFCTRFLCGVLTGPLTSFSVESRPDLTGAITHLICRPVGPRDLLLYRVRILNIGTEATAESFSVMFFLSNDATLDAGGDTLLRSREVTESLLPGEGVSLFGISRAPHPIEGQFLLVQIDAEDTIEEANEGNNLIVSQPIPCP